MDDKNKMSQTLNCNMLFEENDLKKKSLIFQKSKSWRKSSFSIFAFTITHYMSNYRPKH